MLPFEQEIKAYFRQHQIAFSDHSESFARLDFCFGDSESKRQFHFDAKEKRQHYNLRNWPALNIPEEHLFILDDLAARKILAYAPNSGLVVRDNMHGRYFFFAVVDLYLMPKQRVNRTLKKKVETSKGKWLIDLRNGQQFDTLPDLFAGIDQYLDQREAIFLHTLACYGNYIGEEISRGGIDRVPHHWQIDVEETR